MPLAEGRAGAGLLLRQNFNPARALRALGLLLADGAPTVHIGPTLAPEAILFESPCRVHSEA